jgi:carbon monoxide dehydrogenase subunit G
MNLNGEYIINAPAKKIWDLLMNPDVLARITPGITKLEKIDADNYKAIAEIKIGPVSGSFTGSLQVTDRNEPQHFTLIIQQNSRMGNANANLQMNLFETAPGTTRVGFTGGVKLSGIMATMGQRVLTPIANTLSKQFFEDLQKEVTDMASV